MSNYTPEEAAALLVAPTEENAAAEADALKEALANIRMGEADPADGEGEGEGEDGESEDLQLLPSPPGGGEKYDAEEEAANGKKPIQLKLIPPEPVRPEYIEVALDLLPPNSQILGPSPARDFIDAVRDYGVIEPIILTYDREEWEKYQEDLAAWSAKSEGGDGSEPRPVFYYGVAAGGRRIKTARSLVAEIASTDLRAKMGIHPMRALRYTTDEWRLVQAWMLNQQRHENLPVALAAVDHLYKQQASDSDIIKAIRCTPQTLNKLKKLRGLQPELRQALADGKMKGSVAEAAARLSVDYQAKLVGVLREKGKLVKPDIEEILRGVRTEAVKDLNQSLFDPVEDEHEHEEEAKVPSWDAWKQPLRETCLVLIELVQSIKETPRRDVKSHHMTDWATKGADAIRRIESILGESAKSFDYEPKPDEDAFEDTDEEDGTEADAGGEGEEE